MRRFVAPLALCLRLFEIRNAALHHVAHQYCARASEPLSKDIEAREERWRKSHRDLMPLVHHLVILPGPAARPLACAYAHAARVSRARGKGKPILHHEIVITCDRFGMRKCAILKIWTAETPSGVAHPSLASRVANRPTGPRKRGTRPTSRDV